MLPLIRAKALSTARQLKHGRYVQSLPNCFPMHSRFADCNEVRQVVKRVNFYFLLLPIPVLKQSVYTRWGLWWSLVVLLVVPFGSHSLPLEEKGVPLGPVGLLKCFPLESFLPFLKGGGVRLWPPWDPAKGFLRVFLHCTFQMQNLGGTAHPVCRFLVLSHMS